MSRTYRRSKSVVPEWVKHDYVCVKVNDKRFYQWIKLNGCDLNSAIAMFHADSTTGGIPSDFKTADKGIKRAKDKVALDKINKDGQYEDYSFNPHKKDYQYNYW